MSDGLRSVPGLAGPRGQDDWIERVRAASDIVEVVGQTVALKRTGRNLTGLCPFHKEKTASFSVNPERQFYHCFGCKAGGDVFRFVQETEKVGFLEAVEILSRRAGIPVPERRGDAGARGARTRLTDALEAAAQAYEQWLGDPQRGSAARAYLERRGITRETQRAFRLGLAPEGWENLVQRLRGKVPDEALIEAGLAAARAPRGPGGEGAPGVPGAGRGGLYDRFRNRLMVPLVASGGTVVGFGARALADAEQPKYLNSPETPVYHKGAFLFALDVARRRADPDGEMIVVEGYFDAIALHQAGLGNTVATSGTALTADQARLLKRVVPRIVLTYDGDAAGQEAMMRSLGVLMGEGLDVAVVDLPAGEDPDTLLRQGGLEAWSAVRARAADPVEFIQRHVLRGHPGGRDPRERALQAVVDLGVRVTDPIRRQALTERASQVFRHPERVIARAMALRRSGQPSEKPIEAAVRRLREGESFGERRLLEALIHRPESLSAARELVTPGDFGDPVCAALAAWVWSERAGFPEDDEAAALARELAASEPEDWEALARGEARRLLQHRLTRRHREKQEELRHDPQGPQAARLLQEIQEIALSIREIERSIREPSR
jgi:DNA primase